MQINRCVSCMQTIESYPCPHCGFSDPNYKNVNYALPVNSILNGRYLIGKMLGQGGFGMTYIGWDLVLEERVAIKEYYPSGLVTRHPGMGTTLLWSSGNQAEKFRQSGMESFLREARKMVKVDDVPAAVHVMNTFTENETAYIAMEFIEGTTLDKYLQKTGPLGWEDAKKIFYPAIEGMAKVHEAGLIHRDLSPDNIMLQANGNVRILDLGAAKDMTINNGASSMLVAKTGFSPIEQYTQRGNSGTWTDVYAMAATLYYSLTGMLPPPSTDRINSDEIRWDLPQLQALPEAVLTALQNAMVVMTKQRTQTMGQFLAELRLSEGKPKKKSKVGLIAAVVLVAAAAAGAGLFFLNRPEPAPEAPAALEAPQQEETAAPEETEPAPPETEPEETAAPAAEPEETEPEETEPEETEPEETEPEETEPADTRPVHVMATPPNLSRISSVSLGTQNIWGWSYHKRSEVKEIVFHDNFDGLPQYEWYYYDVSAAKDKSILIWMDGSTLHVSNDGRIEMAADARYLFAGFTKLESIDFGNCFDTSKVQVMSYFYGYCPKMEKFSFAELDTSSLTDASNLFTGSTGLRSIEWGKFDSSKVTDMSSMFYGCTGLSTLDLSSLDFSRVSTTNYMFGGCRNLNSLNFGDANVENVRDMNYMFYGCSGLQRLDLSSFRTNSLQTTVGMFQNCSWLRDLDVSNFNTFKVTTMDYMFNGCSSLNEPDLSSFDFSNVTSYEQFMSYDKTVNGRDWRKLFWQEMK